MPRAPHSIALLAGRPRAKRRVFSSRIVFCRSTPLQQADIHARDTGDRCEPGLGRCQTNASAAARSIGGGGGGASRSSASAMRRARSVQALVHDRRMSRGA